MRTTAKIIDTNIGKRVRVDLGRSVLCDWPIMYDDGTIAYDYPELVPQFIRPKIARLLRQLKAEKLP